MRHRFPVICLLACCVPAALGQEPPPAAPQAPITQEAVPSTELPALLDQIEAKAKTIHSMDSRIRLTRKQGLLGDEQVRFGRFRYAAAQAATDTPAKARIDFDGVVVDGKKENADIHYVFDGHWLLETNAKDHAATRREIRTKDDPVDALAIGGGPWPIPLSFEKTAVLAKFTVHLGPAGPAADGRQALRLILTPRPGAKLEVDRMVLVFEKDTWEPIGATSLRGEDATEVLLAKPAFNGELPPDVFDTKAPEGAGWHVEEVPKQ